MSLSPKRNDSMGKERNINKFNQDIEHNKGYYYIKNPRLSCQLANQRLSKAIIEMSDLHNKSVIDIGCGDGTFTVELMKRNPRYILGIDAAKVAVKCAKKKSMKFNNLDFCILDIYNLDSFHKKFDIAIVRGVLHHLYYIEKAIENISKIADEIIVVEPNGYNIILKIIEKTSKYHIEHEEKSYFFHHLDWWFRQNGGKLEKASYCGIVPMFCPDIMALLLKKIEPLIEKIPFVRQLVCAVYVMKIRF